MRVFAQANQTLLSMSVIAMSAVTANASPLEIVRDGREEAANSRLNEDGMIAMSQQAVNIILFICGAAGILLTAIGIYQLWSGQAMDDGGYQASNSNKRGIIMIVCGGLLTISAVIAAVVPYAVLGAAGG